MKYKTVEEVNSEIKVKANRYYKKSENDVFMLAANYALDTHYAPLLAHCEEQEKVIRELIKVLGNEIDGKNHPNWESINTALTNAKKLLDEK